MLGDSVLRAAFLISFSGHCLFLGATGFAWRLPVQEKKPKEITVIFETEKPALLPKIDTLGPEKKLKEVKEELEQREFKQQSRVRDALEQVTSEEKVKVTKPFDAAMLRYQDVVKQRIEEARRYPAWAKKQGIEGITRLYFTVLSNGLSRDITIIRSSGSGILDEEAVATVKRASPFPSVPGNIGSSSVGMEVAIVFSLNKKEVR
ncbi:MAG: TonB family protein [Candidatus Omnitrophota bacterium]